MTRTLVLGIGNTLLTDEGCGVHVLDQLRELGLESHSVTLLDGGTLSFMLTETIQKHEQLVVLDAAQLGEAPGTLRCLVNEEMDRFLGKCKRSAHEVGLLDLMDIARLTDSLPRRRALIGIQPEVVDWGTEPTPAVAEAIPLAVEEVCRLLDEWQAAAQRQEACA